MRVWRKLHASILDSSDVAGLSDAAALLLTFLITAQDDTGYYPWNPTKIKRLTLTRNWSTERSQTLAEELCAAGITHFEEGGILLLNGAKLNGKPRKGVEEESYPRNANPCNPPRPADSLTTALQQPAALEQSRESRVEKSRVEQSREIAVSPPLSDEDKTDWPDWYATLYAIPGFKRPFKEANAWREAKGISEEHAETTAYALKGKWTAKQYPDAWATFQNWAKRPPLGGSNVDGAKGTPEGIASLAKFGRTSEAPREAS